MRISLRDADRAERDGRIVPRRIAIMVGWPVEEATKPAKLETAMVLELEADGAFVVAR
jgi:hypothetical protein